MSVIDPVQSHCHEGSPVGKRSLRWEGFAEKVGFEPGERELWVERRTRKVCRSKTGAVPLCHATNQCSYQVWKYLYLSAILCDEYYRNWSTFVKSAIKSVTFLANRLSI